MVGTRFIPTTLGVPLPQPPPQPPPRQQPPHLRLLRRLRVRLLSLRLLSLDLPHLLFLRLCLLHMVVGFRLCQFLWLTVPRTTRFLLLGGNIAAHHNISCICGAGSLTQTIRTHRRLAPIFFRYLLAENVAQLSKAELISCMTQGSEPKLMASGQLLRLGALPLNVLSKTHRYG